MAVNYFQITLFALQKCQPNFFKCQKLWKTNPLEPKILNWFSQETSQGIFHPDFQRNLQTVLQFRTDSDFEAKVALHVMSG